MTSSALQVKKDISALSGELSGTITNAIYATNSLTPDTAEAAYTLLSTGNKAATESISKWNIPGIQDFRLTFKSGSPTMLPVNLNNLTEYNSVGTIYFTPFKGNQVSLWTNTNGWVIYESDEIAISLSATSNDTVYDMFLYDTGSALAIELAARSHTRGSVSNAASSTYNEKITISTPVAHGLSVGDAVAVRNVGGKTGANGIQVITNVTGTSFTFRAYDPTAYTAGGNWSRLNESAVSITYKDGVRVKSSDNRKRYIGTVATGAKKGITSYNPLYLYPTQVIPARCLLWNENNRIKSSLICWWEDGYSISPTVDTYNVQFRPGNNNEFKIEFLVGPGENEFGGGFNHFVDLAPTGLMAHQQVAYYIVCTDADSPGANTGSFFGTNKSCCLGRGGSATVAKKEWYTSEGSNIVYLPNLETKYSTTQAFNLDPDPSAGSPGHNVVPNIFKNLNLYLHFWW